MKLYLVSMTIVSMGFEKGINALVRAKDEKEASRIALLDECHEVEDDTFDANMKNGYLEDAGFAYKVDDVAEVKPVFAHTSQGKEIAILTPNSGEGFYSESTIKELSESKTPFLVSLCWLVDGFEKVIEVVEWGDSNIDAMSSALAGECHEAASDDDLAKIKAGLIIEKAGLISEKRWSAEDASGLYKVRSVERLEVVYFNKDGQDYGGLIRQGALSENTKSDAISVTMMRPNPPVEA